MNFIPIFNQKDLKTMKNLFKILKNIRETISKHNLLISVFLVLSFIISIFIFRNIVRNNVIKSLVKETESINERSEVFSNYTLEINKNMCFFIYNDSDVTELRNLEEFDLSKASMLLRNVNNILTSGNYIDSVYIYNARLDYIFSTVREGNRPNKFFDKKAVDLFYNREEFDNFAPILREYNSTSSSLKQIYSFMLYDDESAVMINISPLIYNGLFSIENTSSPSYIIDSDLNVITSSSKQRQLNIDNYLETKLIESINDKQISGYIMKRPFRSDSPILIYSKTTNNDWYYLLVDTYASLFPSFVSFERISNTILTILTILLVLILFLFVIPYYRIHRSISSIDNKEIDVESNLLHEKLNRLIELSLDSKRMNNSISIMMKEEMLKTYIYGTSQNNIEEVLNEYDLKLDINNDFKLILINNSTRNKDYKDIASNYTDKYEGVLLGGHHVLLLVQGDNNDIYSNIINDINKNTTNKRQIILSPYTNFNEIHKTYEYLRRLALLFNLKEDLIFIDCDKLKDFNNLSKDELHNKVRNIISLLKDAKLKEASLSYEEYMNNINDDIDNDLRIIRYLKQDLEESLSKLDPNITISNEDIDKFIKDKQTRNNIDKYFFDIFQRISILSVDDKKAKAIKISNKVIEILKKKYKDSSLSTQAIADELNLSYAYCSRVFKQVNNQSISNYLNDIRLEEACNLLKQKDIQIKDISSLVGFENHQYFFVLFKNKYGETPRSYHLKHIN